MHTYRLPDTLPLHTEGPPVLKFKDGTLVAEATRTYPSLFASLEDVKAATAQERGRKRPRKEISDKWPVAMDEEGLWTDFRWWVFQVFVGDKRHFDSHHQPLMEALAKDPSLWDVRCPTMQGHETLTGQLMAAYGEQMGGGARRRIYSPTQGMMSHPLVRSILAGKKNSQLREFQDRGRTLLDLATSHQQWEMAESLWKKGVRWSETHLQSGQALEGLIVGWMGLRQSTYEGWLKGENDAQTQALRTQWLDTWLGRYEGLGVGPVTEALLDRRHRALDESGMKTNRFLDTPASLFLAHMFHVDGPRTSGLHSMPGFSREMLERWLDFWTRQGVDLASEPIPKPVSWEGAPPETTDVLTQWTKVEGLAEVILEKQMHRQLPDTPMASRKTGPGQRL